MPAIPQMCVGLQLRTIDLYCIRNIVLFTIHSSKEIQIRSAVEAAPFALTSKKLTTQSGVSLGYGRKREIDESA